MAKDVKAVPKEDTAAVAESTAVSEKSKEEVKAQHASLFEISLILKPYFWPRYYMYLIFFMFVNVLVFCFIIMSLKSLQQPLRAYVYLSLVYMYLSLPVCVRVSVFLSLFAAPAPMGCGSIALGAP
jgi:hypothetical protein